MNYNRWKVSIRKVETSRWQRISTALHNTMLGASRTPGMGGMESMVRMLAEAPEEQRRPMLQTRLEEFAKMPV